MDEPLRTLANLVGRLRRVTGGWALVTAMVLVAMTTLASCSTTGNGFVQQSGPKLTLNGKPFRFVGFNLYDAAASDVYSCSPNTRLDDAALARTLAYIHDKAGATVVRFWAYQTYTAGGTNFSGVDRFLAAADKAGLHVLPVLEDGPGYCSTGQSGVPLNKADSGTWYSKGYRTPYGSAHQSYRSYVGVMARHYRNNATILGWTMMNEAETSKRESDQSVLVPFAKDIASVIHRADPNHLVTLGTQSNGAPGASGRDFAAVYGLRGLDFTEVHDYAYYGSDTEAMPGSQMGTLPSPTSSACRRTNAKIACSFAIAKKLHKPIVVGESGIQAQDQAGRESRAKLMSAKMKAAFSAGASGYLVWHLDVKPTDPNDHYAVDPTTTDPLFATMLRISRGLRR